MIKAITKIDGYELQQDAMDSLEGAGVGVALGMLSRTLGGLDLGSIPIDGSLAVLAALGARMEDSKTLAEISGDCAAVFTYRKFSKKS